MSEEELQEQIIQQIEVLVEELGGTMCQLTRCNSMGRQSKVLEIEYNVEEKNWKQSGEYGNIHLVLFKMKPLKNTMTLFVL